jgi:DNA-binding NtrC family response regulator
MPDSRFAQRRQVSVLLVDSDAAVRFALADYLTGHRFEVECAVDAAAAEAWLCRRRFDAVLSDLQLGDPREAGGLAVAQRVRLLSPSTVVCLLTRPGSPALMEEAERVADAVLFRPRPLADIAQIILAFVARPVESDDR